MAPYETYREQILIHHEAFASFLYLDTRGFLTSGLGYLYIRDASKNLPGASIQTMPLALLKEAGIALTAAQQATFNGVVNAMEALPAAYDYPAFNNLAAFNQSPMGKALAPLVKLKGTRTDDRRAFTYKVEQAAVPTGFADVEPLFADETRHAAYFALMARPFEADIDRALAQTPVDLTDSQRVGIFSVDWNLPSSTAGIVKGLANGIPRSAMRALVAKGRSVVAAERIDLETDLILGAKTADVVFEA